MDNAASNLVNPGGCFFEILASFCVSICPDTCLGVNFKRLMYSVSLLRACPTSMIVGSTSAISLVRLQASKMRVGSLKMRVMIRPASSSLIMSVVPKLKASGQPLMKFLLTYFLYSIGRRCTCFIKSNHGLPSFPGSTSLIERESRMEIPVQSALIGQFRSGLNIPISVIFV